jgi:hypothetical protein
MTLRPPFAKTAKDGAPRYAATNFGQAKWAAGCCIRPGSPVMADQEPDPSLPLRVSPADSHPSTRKNRRVPGTPTPATLTPA